MATTDRAKLRGTLPKGAAAWLIRVLRLLQLILCKQAFFYITITPITQTSRFLRSSSSCRRATRWQQSARQTGRCQVTLPAVHSQYPDWQDWTVENDYRKSCHKYTTLAFTAERRVSARLGHCDQGSFFLFMKTLWSLAEQICIVWS